MKPTLKDEKPQLSNCCNAPVRLNKPNARRGETIFYICNKCNKHCSMKPQLDGFYDEPQEWENPTLKNEKLKQEDWEKKYYKEFGQFNHLILYTGNDDGTISNEPVQEKVYDFIKEAISIERHRVLEEVKEKVKKVMDEYEDNYFGNYIKNKILDQFKSTY